MWIIKYMLRHYLLGFLSVKPNPASSHARSFDTAQFSLQLVSQVARVATWCNADAIVAKSRSEFYFSQRLLQRISQHFFALRGMLHAAMLLRATCVATRLETSWIENCAA